MDNLTKKQQGFVKDYLETGNATEAVRRNYNVSDDLTARVIGSENLTKPNIQEVIKSLAERIDDDTLILKHRQFLNSDKEEIGIKALDMGYKLKGAYAPEKSIALNVNADITNPKAKELADKYEEELKKNL